MSYYRNNDANREALFGPSSSTPSSSGGGGGGGRRTTPSGIRTGPIVDFSTYQRKNSTQSSTTSTTAIRSTAATGTISSNSSISSQSASSLSTGGGSSMSGGRYNVSSKRGGVMRVLTGQAKMTKMKEAEEYRDKAKKAMERGLFSKPDPVIAATYYRRAAEIYKQCGENRLERLHRIACADCQRGQDAYASAAAEYTRAAELAAVSDESDPRKRNECSQLCKSAAEAWLAINEKGKAGQCLINSACGLLIGVESSEDDGTPMLLHMDRKALTAFEEAIEAHVPDPLNRFRTYRQTGTSAYLSSADQQQQQSRLVAQENIVSSPYAHEAVSIALRKLVQFTEYSSALYAAGAVSTLLEREMATISLHRAYLTETIIQLAMKDVVAADKTFLETHLQRNSYLQSRECKLAEDLIRAVKCMDMDALDAAKVDNRAALANLDPTLRLLVMNLRVSGVASSKKKVDAMPQPVAPQPMSTEPIAAKAAPADQHLEGEELAKQLEANYAEMDKIMEDMGFNDMEEDEEEEEDDDSDIDLR